ncbi:MAG TPA: translation elongation factor Ts [Thermoguttaceae bacterium]|nr:translation elongation factor Ts [Thermoguttaceae bacterium]
MAEITAAAVKSLRERTGLPMMDCKKALEEAAGDAEKAIEILRKAGKKTMEKRVGRETPTGRIAIFLDRNKPVGTIVDLRCESAPVASNEQFVQLADDLAKQLATGPGAATPDALLDQPSPSNPKQTLRQQFDDLNNRIREVFKLQRIARIDGVCGGYAHHNGAVGVLLHAEGGTPELAKDVCMHVAAMRPAVLGVGDLDPVVVAKEREILSEAARGEGKPEKIIEKMVEGRLHSFYAEQCLTEQPFVKDDSQSVGNVAKAAGMKLVRFIHWELGKD